MKRRKGKKEKVERSKKGYYSMHTSGNVLEELNKIHGNPKKS